jgi:hypothetical protein
MLRGKPLKNTPRKMPLPQRPITIVQAPEEETRNWAEYVNTQYGSPLVYSDEALKKIRYFTVPKSRKLREAFERLANELR